MSVMEHMTYFISSLKTQTRILLDASARGMLINKTKDKVKTLIENMCQNEYRSNDRIMKPKGMLAVDSNT